MEENLITYDEFKAALNIVNKYKEQVVVHYKNIKKEIDSTSNLMLDYNGNIISSETKITDTNLSVRTLNSIRAGLNLEYDSTINDLSKYSISDILKIRNSGKKTLDEIKELCYFAGVTLKK